MKPIGPERTAGSRRSPKLPREPAALAPPKGRALGTRGPLHAVPAADAAPASDSAAEEAGPVSSRFQSLVADAKKAGGKHGAPDADLRRDYDNLVALLKRRESELREREFLV